LPRRPAPGDTARNPQSGALSCAALRPIPPGASKQKEVRYLDIREDDHLDEARLAAWVK
jgi:hypothetical protein